MFVKMAVPVAFMKRKKIKIIIPVPALLDITEPIVRQVL